MTKPFFIYEITPRCNRDCVYCYNVWKESPDYPTNELSVPQIKALFDKVLSDVRPSGVTLTGGEPLLHEGIFEVASYLDSKGVRLGIATNGSLLDDAAVRSLIGRGVKYFEVSLPRADEPGARKAVLSVKKHKAVLNVSVVVTGQNKTEIADIIDLAFAFSADSVSLNRFVPGGRGLSNIPACMISDKELAGVLYVADKKAGELGLQVNVTVPVEDCLINHGDYRHLNFGTCTCGEWKWVIDPSGNLRTCEQNPEILGNLFEKRFRELAASGKVSAFRDRGLNRGCDDCARRDECGGGCRILHAREKVMKI